MRCNLCNQDKDEKEFQTYWHSTQQTTRTRKQCNKCFYGNRMKNKNPEKYYADKPEYRKCIGCNEYKLIKKDFYVSSKGKIYIVRCKTCELTKTRQERADYLKENCGSEKVLKYPNRYTDEYQKECTFNVMERLGYVYDTITGIWTKEPFKTIKNGKPHFPNIGKTRKIGTPITPEMIEKMLELRKRGWKFKRIADHLSVSDTSVFNYLRKYDGKVD